MAESSKIHGSQTSRWYNERKRGGGSQGIARSSNVQKTREIRLCEIMERLESKKLNLKMNAILYKKPVKLLTVNSNMFYRTSSGL